MPCHASYQYFAEEIMDAIVQVKNENNIAENA